MNFDRAVALLGRLPFFDLPAVLQITGEKRADLQTQLYRWARAGKLILLRRGMYTLAERYRQASVNPAELANHLYRPSYLSGLWALGYYGLIPEQVVQYTSVTPRVPRLFENDFGEYEYRHLKAPAFFGYCRVRIQTAEVLMAEPEKALLDFWHLTTGAWTEDRMVEMRFQNQGQIRATRLRACAARFDSPRLFRAVAAWQEAGKTQNEGTVQL